MDTSGESLSESAKRLKHKYHLTDFSIDAECLFQEGDLSLLLKQALSELLPGEDFEITEDVTKDLSEYVATINYKGQKLMHLFADTGTDWLPEDFWQHFESIPVKMKSDKRFCSINDLVLMGQVAWYFCGTAHNLALARNEGLPIDLPQ